MMVYNTKRSLYLVLIVIVIVIIGYYFTFNDDDNNENEDNDKITGYSLLNNKISYENDRGDIVYNQKEYSEDDDFVTYLIQFKSKSFRNIDSMISGLLVFPKKDGEKLEDIPGILLIPGAGGTKETWQELARNISEMGYVVLTIDSRGVGDSKGAILSFEEDYKVYSEGSEPTQHMVIYDLLRGIDLLRNVENVDENKIAIVAESMGARYGIIATGVDESIKGIVAISTSGFHIQNNFQPQTSYLSSIDPDYYVFDISPRKLFMFHCKDDNIVKIDDALVTFMRAKEPKTFKEYEGCSHGYSPVMREDLENSLNEIFS